MKPPTRHFIRTNRNELLINHPTQEHKSFKVRAENVSDIKIMIHCPILNMKKGSEAFLLRNLFGLAEP